MSFWCVLDTTQKVVKKMNMKSDAGHTEINRSNCQKRKGFVVSRILALVSRVHFFWLFLCCGPYVVEGTLQCVGVVHVYNAS